MFGFNNFFGIAASIVSIVGFVPYIWSIAKGQTRPSAASWWTWSLLAVITTASSWAAGASWDVLLLPLWLCFSQLLIAILSVKRGDNNWDFLNKTCVAFACIGILLWWITGQALVALVIGIICDIFASIPNFRHVWANPEQESRAGWTLGWLASVLQIFAISAWTVADSAWALYFFCNMTIVFVLLWRRSFLRVIGQNT